jgi:hypothetical protein
MKSQTQALVLIIVLVGLVGGVTFVRNWISTKPTQDGPLPPPTSNYQLSFPVQEAEGVADHEIQRPGHYDFWFKNANPHAVEVGLEWKNCKCSEVDIRLLTPEEEAQVERLGLDGSTISVLEASGGVFPALGPAAALHQEVQRFSNQPESLKRMASEEGKVIPAVVPAQAAGFIRLRWVGRQLGPELLQAKLWGQAPGDQRTREEGPSLRVPVVLVAAIRLSQETVTLDDLLPNDQRRFEFLCWSSTRSQFKLESVKEESGNPCFVTSATPLTGKDLDKAVQELKKPQGPPTQVLCGYRVRVTVNERLPNNGPQLDLGPFDRKIAVTTDQDPQPLLVTVKGVVRGEITVGTEDSRDKIILKSFSAKKGTSMTVPLESTQPGLKLKIDSVKPDYLEADLEEKGDQGGGRKRWDLRVTVPPRDVGGMLQDSAVILKTESQPPRFIRIPVLGRATVTVSGF